MKCGFKWFGQEFFSMVVFKSVGFVNRLVLYLIGFQIDWFCI